MFSCTGSSVCGAEPEGGKWRDNTTPPSSERTVLQGSMPCEGKRNILHNTCRLVRPPGLIVLVVGYTSPSLVCVPHWLPGIPRNQSPAKLCEPKKPPSAVKTGLSKKHLEVLLKAQICADRVLTAPALHSGHTYNITGL